MKVFHVFSIANMDAVLLKAQNGTEVLVLSYKHSKWLTNYIMKYEFKYEWKGKKEEILHYDDALCCKIAAESIPN